MEKIVKQTLLFDFYGELLTEHQKKIYEFYYLHDLSLGEISEQEGISRQGVYDAIKRCDKLLEHYESKLRLLDKFSKNKKRIVRIQEITDTILKNNNEYTKEEIIKRLKEINLISNNVIDDLL
ncbi:MAG: YlxM family DNA-binding protein [Eubacteriales bacterium]